MADNNVRYTIPSVPRPTARDEWEDLLETLSRSGTLRVLNGLFGRFADVSEVLLDQANSPIGRNLIGSAAVLGDLAGTIPAEKVQPLSKSFQRGLQRAGASLEGKPPSTRQVLALLHDKDTRRALYAGLEILRTIGEDLPGAKHDEKNES